MNTQIKVQNINTINSIHDLLGIQLAESKLVLVETSIGDGLIYRGKEGKFYKPILISETEKIEVGDWIYNTRNRVISKVEIFQGSVGYYNPDKSAHLNIQDCHKKILALPEHFSSKHLQAILYGKMKDGDKVLVECDKQWDVDPECPTGLRETSNYSLIKLNQSNHITLHKVEEKMYTIHEVHTLTHKILSNHNDILPDAYSRMSNEELDSFHNKWFEQNIK